MARRCRFSAACSTACILAQVIFSLGRRDAVPLSHIVAGCQAVRRGCSLPLDVVGKGMKPRVWLGGTS